MNGMKKERFFIPFINKMCIRDRSYQMQMGWLDMQRPQAEVWFETGKGSVQGGQMQPLEPVSYTHLDVYKRQKLWCIRWYRTSFTFPHCSKIQRWRRMGQYIRDEQRQDHSYRCRIWGNGWSDPPGIKGSLKQNKIETGSCFIKMRTAAETVRDHPGLQFSFYLETVRLYRCFFFHIYVKEINCRRSVKGEDMKKRRWIWDVYKRQILRSLHNR